MAARRRSHCRWDDLTSWSQSYKSGAENEMGEKVPKRAEGPTFFEKVPLGVCQFGKLFGNDTDLSRNAGDGCRVRSAVIRSLLVVAVVACNACNACNARIAYNARNAAGPG